ncbi:PAS domain S-box-containing protein [Algoriphagus faecimaris]|uniref:histidine kinase n=1 Tax=Algoriphagus faecimaris TaxID=686796 RepID=A0A1G6WYF2_9BACT|nr:PAS domain-containing protein [Algoriphagus faecimaris]SDD70861.1 PAS domain S-box-containing protein [Algoriphagus faecimaris]
MSNQPKTNTTGLKSIQELERLIHAIEKIAKVGHWEVDLQSGENRWSDQFFEILGLDPSTTEASTELGLSSIHPDDRDRAEKAYGNSFEKGENYKVEKRIVRPNGEIRYVISEGVVEKDEEGKPIKLFGVFKDITTEKILELETNQKSRGLHSIFQTTKDLIVELSWDGKIVNISNSCFEILGYQKEELIGTLMKELVHPDDLAKTMQTSMKVREGEEVDEFENRYLRKNGRHVHLSWSISVDRDNQVLFLIARDISAKLQEEHQTQEVLDRLHRAQSIGKIGYWELDLESFDIFWSNEIYNIWEIDPSTQPNIVLFEQTIHPEDKDEFLAHQNEALKGKIKLDKSHRILLPSGQVKYVHERGELCEDPSTKKRSLRGTVQDITEQREIELQLIQRNEFIEATLKNLPLGIAVNKISTGETTYINPAFEAIYGWPGSVLEDVNTFFKAIYPDPEYRASMVSRIMEDMKSGDPERMAWKEVTITTEKGEKRIVSAKNIPLPEQDLMISTVLDDTDRYWAEQALKNSNERFHLATQAVTDAIFDWNILEKKIFWGKGYHYLFGYPKEMEYVNEGFWDSCVHPEDLPGIMKTIVAARKDPNVKNWEGEYRFKKADGSYAYVKENTTIQRDESGQAIRIVGALQDITKDKLRKEELLQKTRFIQTTADTTQALLEASNWENVMDRILQLMGRTIGADRAYFFRIVKSPSGELVARQDNEWTNGKVSAEIDNPDYQAIPIKDHPLLLRDIQQRKPFTIITREAEGATRQILAEQGIKSLINIPVFVNNRYLGHIGFDDCFEERKWTEDEKGYIQSIITNLTFAIERKENLDRLADALENNINILESIGDAFYSVDQEFTVTYWNNQAENLTGLFREKVLGENLWKVVGKNENPDFRKNLYASLESQTPISFETFDNWINAWLEVSVYPKKKGLSIFIQNITERKEAEKEIAEFNERFTIISNASHDAIWDWDIVKEEHYWGTGFNKLLGEEVAGLQKDHNRWLDAIHPEDKEHVHSNLFKLLDDPKETFFESEYRIINKSHIIYVVDKGTIIRDEKGKPLRMVGAIQDISHRKRYEESLKSLNEKLMSANHDLEISNKELEQFAYVASHDLQEPLRMISSFLGLIERKYDNTLDDKGKQYIRFAVDGAKRMRDIILDLLNFSRLRNTSEVKTWVSLPKIMEEVSLLNKKSIRESHATIEMDKLPVILGHESAMIQLFHNLISNSIKYRRNGEAPEIKINFTEDNDFWFFSIHDNGIGMEKAYLEKIFIIFQRLHLKEQYPGSGIGLAICKKIVEMHGGKIWAESTLGEGSSFHFSIKKPS